MVSMTAFAGVGCAVAWEGRGAIAGSAAVVAMQFIGWLLYQVNTPRTLPAVVQISSLNQLNLILKRITC
jgi:hypothetical protein